MLITVGVSPAVVVIDFVYRRLRVHVVCLLVVVMISLDF